MRPRCKSMFVEKSAAHADCKSEDNEWLLEDKLKLIVKIKDLVPNKDHIPYDERAEYIKWKQITIGSYSTSEIKETFYNILKDTRTYRMLSEILKDAERNLLSALDIRKPLSSFALFIHENKDEITSKYSEMSGSYTKAASNMFKSLTDEEREEYIFKHQKAKKDYANELSKFNLDSTREKKNSTKSSPFLYYWKEAKRNDNTANYHNFRKEFSEMKPKDKLLWILEFLGVCRGNLLTLEQYEKAVTCLSKDEMSLIDDYEKRPKKINAFNMFMKKYLKATGNQLDRANIFKTGVESWKNLNENEKIKFKNKSIELKKQYDKDYNAFLESLPEERRIYESNKKSIPKNILHQKTADENTDKVKNKKKKKKQLETLEISDKDKNEMIEEPTQHNNDKELPEENMEIKAKKKRSRKLKTNENQESTETSKALEPTPKKIRKLSNDVNVNNVKKATKNMVTPKKRKSNEFDFVKPPSSLYKYFVLQVFKGPREKSKSAFKALTKRNHKKLTEDYDKMKTEYLKKFEQHLVSLSAEEIASFAKKINENGSDDNMSDITDSD